MRRADQLPLLQYTLNRMRLRARERSRGERVTLTLADYDAIGGLSGALDAHADQIFAELGKERWPVVEWIFRALTAGSTIAEAVRQPTRFGDLVKVCGGNEQAARAVVDAFRAPGVNFLVPELDSRKPKLADDAFVDISHESLIRQWKKLSAWLDKEARAAQQWRRLVDRHATGEPLHGRELANLIAWRTETDPNAAWAKRYGGDYARVMTFLDASQQTERRQRITRLALRGAAVVALAAAPLTYLVQDAKNQRQLAEIQENRRLLTEEQLKATNYELMALQAKELRESADRTNKAYTQFVETVVFNITQKTKDSDINVAVVVATESLALVRNRANENRSDTDVKRLLSVVLNIFGDVKLRANDNDAAGRAFDESLTITRELTNSDPKNSLWQDDLALALVRVARVTANRASGAVRANSAEASARLEEARKLYEEATGIDRRLVAADPSEHALNNFQAHLGPYGDLLVRIANLAAARDVYVELLDIRRRRLALDKDNVSRAQDVAAALEKVGQTLRQLGDLEGARKAFDEEIEIDRQVAARLPNDVLSQQNLAISLINAGDTKARANELAEARKLYEQAMELRRKVLAADPENASKTKSLSDVLDRVGNMARQLAARETVVERQRAEREAARKAFDEELVLDRKLALRDPENTQWQRDLLWSLNRVGDLQREINEFAEALKTFDEAVQVATKLVARNSADADQMRSLASVWDKVGGVKDKLNDRAGTQKAYEELLDLRRQVAARDPENSTWQKDISTALDKLGEVMQRSGNMAGARRMFDEELAIDRRFALKDPENLPWQVDLVWSLNKVGDLQRQTRNFQEARKNYDEAVSIDRKIVEREPNSPQRYRKLSSDHSKLARLLLDLNEFAAARKAYGEIFESDQRLLKVVRQQHLGSENATTRNDLIETLGALSWSALLSSQPQSAFDYATEALKLDPSKTWIKVNLGHAYLFTGRYEDAKAIYLAVKDVPSATAGRTYGWYVKDDYSIFRKLQIATPEMSRVEQEVEL
jgi:tetratricopeptide (TPR) repeat protein